LINYNERRYVKLIINQKEKNENRFSMLRFIFTFEFRRYVMGLSSSCDVRGGSDYNSEKGGNHCEKFD
jgi:hypothetical protein